MRRDNWPARTGISSQNWFPLLRTKLTFGNVTVAMRRLMSPVLSTLLLVGCAAPMLDPLVDYRYQGVVHRNANGSTARSQQVIAAFKKEWACPATGLHSGPCPGWAIDHVIPLDCGGVDAVWNLQWLPDQIKSARGEYSKDHFERRVYGGRGLSKGCP